MDDFRGECAREFLQGVCGNVRGFVECSGVGNVCTYLSTWAVRMWLGFLVMRVWFGDVGRELGDGLGW